MRLGRLPESQRLSGLVYRDVPDMGNIVRLSLRPSRLSLTFATIKIP
jgi:hypothetical protein